MSSPPRQRSCPRCSEAMHVLTLSTRGAAQRSTVEVEHCRGCRLVWFDSLESVQLDGLGWIELLRECGSAAERPMSAAAQTPLRCPACSASLREVHNQTRFGRFRMMECPQRHGHLQTDSGLFAERGLVHPLRGPERLALSEERRPLHCFQCGAPAEGADAECAYCGSPLVVLDLQRLARALRVQIDDASPAARPQVRPLVWPCRGCGTALDPSCDVSCPTCGHLVVAPSLKSVEPVLEAARVELEAAGAARAKWIPRPRTRRQRTPRETSLGILLHHIGVDVGGSSADDKPAIVIGAKAVLGLALLAAILFALA